jgi:uncharacterized membrane protein
MDEPSTPIPPSGTPPGPPNLIDIINVIAQRADSLLNLAKGMMDQHQKGQEREDRFQIHMAWIALSVVMGIVGIAAFLTYHEKIDGSTFTFLLGLVVGYVLTFVRDQITGPE